MHQVWSQVFQECQILCILAFQDPRIWEDSPTFFLQLCYALSSEFLHGNADSFPPQLFTPLHQTTKYKTWWNKMKIHIKLIRYHDKRQKTRFVVCLSAWNCCQDSQLSWPLLPRLQLHVAGKTWAEIAHCTGLRYAAMLWFLGVNFLWIRTSLDISGHLWTFGSFGWLRVGFELAKWLVEMELHRSSVRISCVPWEGFPTRQRTRVAKK